jgi:hypothetical protein
MQFPRQIIPMSHFAMILDVNTAFAAATPFEVEHVELYTVTDPMGERIMSKYSGREVIGPMTPADDESYLFRLSWREAHGHS